MKKIHLLAFFLLGMSATLVAQKVAHAGISKTNISLRGNAVVLGQISLDVPATGKVILRFDGVCLSSVGDRIVLAASQTTNWGPNDDCVELEAASLDINSNPFSHTRAYDVAPGMHTFYAVAQNFYELNGSGVASVYGNLTAEWFPEEPGKAFARHKGFYYENILVEGAPTAFSSLTIDAPTAGKVLVRFDGKCVSNYGDLIFFAASDSPNWTNYDGSTSNEVISNDLNHFSFSHVRAYEVTPGPHTFYAVVENYFEVYGNGFASVYGSLTVEFYPAASPVKFTLQPVNTQFGVNIEGPPVAVGQIQVNAPVAGKVLVNFAGTCIASNGDQIRLAASDTPNWGPEDGNVVYEPYSSDHNRTSFSHTRVYDVGPGDHTFYGVIQNYEEYDGSGLAVVYASFTTQFFPEQSTATVEPQGLGSVALSPNPASSQVEISFPDLIQENVTLSLIDGTGKILRTAQKNAQDRLDRFNWDVQSLPAGIYGIKITIPSGSVVRKLIKI